MWHVPHKCRCLCIERRYRRSEWRVFRDVSQCFKNVSSCFKSVSWCFTSGSRCFTTFHNASQCFTRVLWCFTMFNNILQYLVSCALKFSELWTNRQSPQGLLTTPQGSAISPRQWSHAKLRNEWRELLCSWKTISEGEVGWKYNIVKAVTWKLLRILKNTALFQSFES